MQSVAKLQGGRANLPYGELLYIGRRLDGPITDLMHSKKGPGKLQEGNHYESAVEDFGTGIGCIVFDHGRLLGGPWLPRPQLWVAMLLTHELSRSCLF